MGEADATMAIQAIQLTLLLAAETVVVLLCLGGPLAWWLAHTDSRAKTPIEAITALPLVLPPTVLGFYLLLFLGPDGPAGALSMSLTGEPLAFSFTGLLIASSLYSLPFVVQPLQTAFEGMDRRALEAAWMLGASHIRAFFTVVLPQIRRGLLTAVVLGFAHTLGEFGVVLMVGGNIPGETQVVSIAIYEYVEVLDYGMAHRLSLGLLLLSFLVLTLVYSANRHWHGGLRA
ncbi:MAG: molybdate ABC transporter permease subunit [Gammaproteobacteria bacterium]